jgi:hypothetical protein
MIEWGKFIATNVDIASISRRLPGTSNAAFASDLLARLKMIGKFQTMFPDLPVQEFGNPDASR